MSEDGLARVRDRRGTGDEVQEGRRPAEVDEEPKPLGQETPEIVDDAAAIGEKRLERSAVGDIITSIIGGLSIGFGVVAMVWVAASLGGAEAPSAAHLAGSLAYPIGFVILLVGKSELFTENFLLPVTGVLERRGSATQLVSLWGRSLFGNLIGAAIFAIMISRAGVLPDAPAAGVIALGDHAAHLSLDSAFIKALFAGWLMTILTWLLLAAEGMGPRLVFIWLIGTMIVLGEFTHVVIGSTEVFMAAFLDAPVEVKDWFLGPFAIVLLGNVIGGVVFVTMLHYVQARYDDADRDRSDRVHA